MGVSITSVLAAVIDDMENSGKNREDVEAAVYGLRNDVTPSKGCLSDNSEIQSVCWIFEKAASGIN